MNDVYELNKSDNMYYAGERLPELIHWCIALTRQRHFTGNDPEIVLRGGRKEPFSEFKEEAVYNLFSETNKTRGTETESPEGRPPRTDNNLKEGGEEKGHLMEWD